MVVAGVRVLPLRGELVDGPLGREVHFIDRLLARRPRPAKVRDFASSGVCWLSPTSCKRTYLG